MTRSTKTEVSDLPARPSIRSRAALSAGRLTIRPLNGLLPNNQLGIWAGRQVIATVMAFGGPPLRGTTITKVDTGFVRGEWVCADGVENADQAIYYLHGSGYVVCSARTHRGLASRLSRDTGLPVFVLDYRLAPEHRFPAAADDVEAGYRWLLDQGYQADQMVVAGDSAGGHLALDLLLENNRHGRPQPAAAVMFSPLVDLDFRLARKHDRRTPEALASAKTGRRSVALYTRDVPAHSPRLRLTIPAGAALPPLFVQVSTDEMLVGDAQHLRDMARAAGVSCDLELWPGVMHVFQALPRLVPEADLALGRAANFINSALVESNRKQVV